MIFKPAVTKKGLDETYSNPFLSIKNLAPSAELAAYKNARQLVENELAAYESLL